MDKPENPYDPESTIWKLYDGDWSRCTVTQIAESLHCCNELVRKYISKVRKQTGYSIPYMHMPNLGKKKREVVKIVFPPSYQPKQETVPCNCNTCWNFDCPFLKKRKAVSWRNCSEYMAESEEVEES